MEKLINNLKNEILNFTANGGNIYSPKRELPYYDHLSYVVKQLRKQNPNITYEDVYSLCGVEFDRDYYNFITFVNELKMYNNNGYVDAIRSTKLRAKNNTYEKLKNYADKYHTTPFNFLVLMTPYSFSNCIIHTENYEETLKYLILCEYPNKDISGIKRQNPERYEQLRQLQNYYPYPISMKELVQKMGLVWPQASFTLPEKVNKKQILNELNVLYPNKIITNLVTQNKTLYFKIVKAARSEQKTISSWLEENGFNYPSAVKIAPLSQIKVDEQSYKKLLKNLKQSALEKMQIQTKNEIELYKSSLAASLQVLNFLNSKSTTEILKLSQEIHNVKQIEEYNK